MGLTSQGQASSPPPDPAAQSKVSTFNLTDCVTQHAAGPVSYV